MMQQRKTEIRIKKKTRSLIRLEQWVFYKNLIEGRPNREMNDRWLARIFEQEREKDRAEPLLIPPIETRHTSSEEFSGHSDRFRESIILPPVVCVGRFRSQSTARDPDKDYSELTIVWFQDDFAFPIQDDILKQLEAVNWNAHATDYEW